MKKYITTPSFNSGNMRKKRSLPNNIYDHTESDMKWNEMKRDELHMFDRPTQLQIAMLQEDNELPDRRPREARSIRTHSMSDPIEYGDTTHCWMLAKSHIGKF